MKRVFGRAPGAAVLDQAVLDADAFRPDAEDVWKSLRF